MTQGQRKGQGGFGSFLVGIILGSIAGAIAALWYAPRSGDETRREIQHQIEGESIDDAMREGKAAAREFTSRQT